MAENQSLFSRLRNIFNVPHEPQVSEMPTSPIAGAPMVSYQAQQGYIESYIWDQKNGEWDPQGPCYINTSEKCEKYAEMLNNGIIKLEDLPEPSQLDILEIQREKLLDSLNAVEQDLSFFGGAADAPDGATGKGEYDSSVKRQSALEKELAELDKQIASLTIAPQQEPVIPKIPPIAEIILHSPGGGLETCTYTDPEAFKKVLREEIDIRGITSVSANVLNDDQNLKYFVSKTYAEEYGEHFPPMNQWQYEKGLSESEKDQFQEKLAFIYHRGDVPEFKDAHMVLQPEVGNFIIGSAFEHLSPNEVGEVVNQRLEALQYREKEVSQETELNLSKEIILSEHAFDDDNYLHFVATVDHQEYEGLFRVHDPVNGPSMQIVSIDNGWQNPAIEAQWDKLTESLRSYAHEKYSELITQENPKLTLQMRELGYTPHFFDDPVEGFIMWKNSKDNCMVKAIGLDGWMGVSDFLKEQKRAMGPRSIKDKLADAKTKCAQLNADRQAGRLAKQQDITR